MTKSEPSTLSSNIEAFGIAQFCIAYGVGKTLVFEEIRRGKLIARKAGARTLIFKADAERWASSLPVAGVAA